MDEIKHGFKRLTEHYGFSDYPLERCAGLQHLLVGKIVLEEITGKRNLPGTLTPADEMAMGHRQHIPAYGTTGATGDF